MPVNLGKEGEAGTFEGVTGNFHAKPTIIADKLIQGKDGRSDALRVVFEVEGKEDTLSLFVPLSDNAADVLHPFIPNTKDVPTDEAGMRSYLASNLPTQTFFVYASRSSIRGTTAKPGKQRVRLIGLHKFSRQSDSQERVRFFAENKDHETVTWTTEYKGIETKVGDKPEEDDIDLSPNPYLFEYLIAFGLDWEQLGMELSTAYEDGQLFPHLGLDGETPGFFNDPTDLTDELYQATRRHSPNRWCDVTIVDHEKYGIGPKRGEWSHIDFTPVIVESNTEFNREVETFLELWENLTKVVMARDEARFMAAGKFTQDGVAMMKAILKPLVLAYPAAVVPDPPVIFNATPSPDTWTLDGLVCASFTAQRLMKVASEDNGALFDLIDLSDHEGTKVLEWAAGNVPEWATIGQEAEAI